MAELNTETATALHRRRLEKLHEAVRELHICYLQEGRSSDGVDQMCFEEARRFFRPEPDAAKRLRKLIADMSPQLTEALELKRTI